MYYAPFATLLAALVLNFALLSFPASAETIGGNPGPQYNYVCPHADGKPALDCYFDAVAHLYTMCRNVKSIEIMEFGYETSNDGLNAAKSESCYDKQKQNIARPYQAALHDAARSKPAVEGLHTLHEAWLAALTQLRWRTGESDDEYKARVGRVYDDFNDRIALIRTSVVDLKPEPVPPPKKTKARASARAKPATKAKIN